MSVRGDGQLDLLDPPAEGWWEYGRGRSTVWVLADSAEEAREKAEAALRDLGVLPGGPPGPHASFTAMCASARRGRRR
ncbi:MAG TPA: hypothetical protein VHA80_03280 [Solirubrobacterales bacterium]|nr:hypothetical protein [Solirubrobacterales bacterium]